jgi:hypothetical protein
MWITSGSPTIQEQPVAALRRLARDTAKLETPEDLADTLLFRLRDMIH